ncbi:MAG: hypothetical protein J6A40_03940 [Bacteroides sp.]|nr:hypothetical protein [Bacteroides sp.]MBO5381226.1 hypothetical protein [Bacteroides sp.]
MNKKFLNAILLGALILGSTGTFTSCKDYDDDINAIEGRLDSLEELTSSITQMKSDIAAAKSEAQNALSQAQKGITDAQAALKKAEDALKEAEASADAAEVEALKAEIASLKNKISELEGTISDSEGKLKDLTALEEKIEQVESALAGKADKSELTSIANEIAKLKEEVKAAVGTELSSLTFIPTAYVDGVEAIVFGSFEYNALTMTKLNSKDENYTKANTATVVNPAVYAEYHVSPSTITLDQLKDKLSFDVLANSDYYSTRAAASKDFAVTPTFESFKNGILKVKVNITGIPATEEKISVIALQVKREDGKVITSDYATVYKQDMDDLAIADPTNKVDDEHYRTLINAENVGYNTTKAWENTADESIDTTFVYDQSLDLKAITAAHALGANKCSAADLEKLGFAFNFEVVKNYKIGNPETPQEEFAKIEDGKLYAKVYDANNGLRAAIGRTPIIRATIVDTNNKNAIVKVAYIKVMIVDTDEAPVEASIELAVPAFKYNCVDATQSVPVKEINVKIYNELGLSFEQFCAKYPNFEDEIDGEKGSVGKVERTSNYTEGETELTDIVKWTVTADEMWNNAAKAISNRVRFFDAAGNYVEFKLTSSVADIQKVYNVTTADYISNYWNAEKTYTKYNVAVPSSTSDDDPANCVFVNNLNASFITWAKNSTDGTPGVLKLDKAVTDIEYFFCKADVEKITKIGDVAVKFTVSTDGLTLSATVNKVTEDIAVINNDNTNAEIPNIITYNKDSEIAKQLLNTSAMYTYIGAKGVVCSAKGDKEVKITFDGKDHFQANFIRPVNIAEKAADNFIDGVDFGEKGSFIRLEDLIAPYDWRDRYFSEYPNYWGYYGEFKITADIANAECDLNGKRAAIPVTVELKQEDAGTMGTGKDAKKSDYGFITYKNNGTKVSEFNIYLKVKVEYGWGIIYTDYIEVPVASTITNN